MRDFEIAGGRVAGADHIRAARNSHDAFRWTTFSRTLIAVVCDGCGSAPHSEVGATLGAPRGVRTIRDHRAGGIGGPATERDFIGRLRTIAAHVGGLSDFFLFTLLAAVI